MSDVFFSRAFSSRETRRVRWKSPSEERRVGLYQVSHTSERAHVTHVARLPIGTSTTLAMYEYNTNNTTRLYVY